MNWIKFLNYFLPEGKEVTITQKEVIKPKRVLTEWQQSIYEKELDVFEKFWINYDKKQQAQYEEEIRLFNEICPKCQSIEVNDRIKEKDITVSVSAHSYGDYGSSSSASVKQSVEAVSKCNSCKNEWIKKTDKYKSMICFYLNNITNVCRWMEDKDYKTNEYWLKIIKIFIPYISVESFLLFRKKYDYYYFDYEDKREYVTDEKLKQLGFKTMEENHGRNNANTNIK